MSIGSYKNFQELPSLKERIRQAIMAVHAGQPGVVDFSGQPHNAITEALHAFAYTEQREAQEPLYIQVHYGAGSQADPFPLCCLPKRKQYQLAHLTAVKPIRASLISMRHLEMDAHVYMAWLLNQQVAQLPTLTKVDEFSYLQTRSQLREALAVGPYKLHLYQTGFQPAVVGFFRALVEELLSRANEFPALEVVPYYFARDKGYYRPGKAWN